MRIALLHGYGQCFETGEVRDVQTIGRCQRAATLYRKRSVSKIIVTAGAKRAGKTKGQALANWLIKNNIDQKDIITSHCDAVNTAGEIDACLDALKYHWPDTHVHIVSVSSVYHLPRIWRLWIARGRWVALEGSWQGIQRRDLALEPRKFWHELWHPHSSAKRFLQTK